MTELTFARAFLAALDSRPVKLSPDHVEDPRSFPARAAQILPKMPKKMSQPRTSAAQPAKSLTVTLKSLRNPPLDVSLPPQDPSTSIHALKCLLESDSGIPASKVRILYRKKPVPDSKVLKDLLAEEDVAAGVDSLELGVMVLGGAASVRGAAAPAPAPAEGDKVAEVAETEGFWGDLRGFLLQRAGDERRGGELYDLFRGAWEASRK